MSVIEILAFIFVFVLSCAIYAGVPQCCWHQFLQHWWLGKSKIQRLHNAFKNKHIDSFNNALIKGNLPPGKNPKSLTKKQQEDLDEQFAKYYKKDPKKLPGTITIFSRRPSFDEYKHFFSNCWYTENDVTFYDYNRKERKIFKRKQRLFVGFAHLEGKPLEMPKLADAVSQSVSR
uniref:Cathepsin propeptide inhibitor domain-containing protein n=1 Tax=Tetranychus urticae TaxID=32264 RepID=T1JVA9_TETUR